MKAILIHQHGSFEQVVFEEIDKPEIRPGFVLVRTQAAALNHLDFFVLKGFPGLNLEMPHVLGSDGAGIVEAVGEGVSRFSAGDPVMLNAVLSCEQCEFCIRGEHSMCVRLRLVGEHTRGTYAEYFTVPEANLEKIPDNVSFEEAAAFSLVFQTAWRMLTTRAHIQPADDVFIHGIGGGVSSAALQIVKLFGGRAFVSSSSDLKLKKAQEMGADFCYNYTKTDVVEQVLDETGKRGVDIVMDSVGASTWMQTLRLVRKGGKIVTCGATTGPNPKTEIRLIFWKQIDILGSTMSNRREYRQLVKLLDEGKLRPVIDRKFPLLEGKEALEYLQSAEQFGKVVLVV
ncbi:zinc-binding dehydrogenase [Acidobacteria bacterium AH-259-L09]|nr:zinc-binding dehydrogenase [Acidobacteria bacterium AH-259-L09]